MSDAPTTGADCGPTAPGGGAARGGVDSVTSGRTVTPRSGGAAPGREGGLEGLEGNASTGGANGTETAVSRSELFAGGGDAGGGVGTKGAAGLAPPERAGLAPPERAVVATGDESSVPMNRGGRVSGIGRSSCAGCVRSIPGERDCVGEAGGGAEDVETCTSTSVAGSEVASARCRGSGGGRMTRTNAAPETNVARDTRAAETQNRVERGGSISRCDIPTALGTPPADADDAAFSPTSGSRVPIGGRSSRTIRLSENESPGPEASSESKSHNAFSSASNMSPWSISGWSEGECRHWVSSPIAWSRDREFIFIGPANIQGRPYRPTAGSAPR